jgi:hypothetical protein
MEWEFFHDHYVVSAADEAAAGVYRVIPAYGLPYTTIASPLDKSQHRRWRLHAMHVEIGGGSSTPRQASLLRIALLCGPRFSYQWIKLGSGLVGMTGGIHWADGVGIPCYGVLIHGFHHALVENNDLMTELLYEPAPEGSV